jgi:hypothetical protein
MELRLKKKKEEGKEKDYPLIVDDDDLNVVFLDEYYGNSRCSSCPFRGLCGG